MIELPSKRDLKTLQTFKEPFCLTIYAPHIDPNAATDPNKIELKNLLREAEIALYDTGVKQKDINKTLRPAKQLIDGHQLWPSVRESLVLFMHPKLFRYYHIPKDHSPYILTVDKGFNLEPLLKVIKHNKQYFVLALGHKNVNLYEGDQYHIKPVKLDDFPTNMKEALNIDELPSWQETHSIAPAGSKGSEAFHGQYNVSQTDKDMLLQFFRRIDRSLHNLLYKREKPLIIGGVEYLLPIYRKANTYPGLLSSAITGNLEHANLQSLREKASSLVNERS